MLIALAVAYCSLVQPGAQSQQDDASWAASVAMTATDIFTHNDAKYIENYHIPEHDKKVALVIYDVLQSEEPAKAVVESQPRLLALAPNSSEIWLWLSNLLLRYRRDKAAAQLAYDESLKLHGSGDKDFAASLAAWTGPAIPIAVRKDRFNKEIQAHAALEANNFGGAAATVERLLAEFSEQEKHLPEYGKAAEFVARCYADAKQKEQAEHFYDEAIKAYSNVTLYDGMPHSARSMYDQQFAARVQTLHEDLDRVRSGKAGP